MRIPNYDSNDDNVSNYKQLYDFIPDQCFGMILVGPSSSGKTNTLMHMIYNLLYYDKIYLYAKNLEQSKYQNILNMFNPISKDVGYDLIIPVSELTDYNQKLVIFDDFVCEKNRKPLIDYFIHRRQKLQCDLFVTKLL